METETEARNSIQPLYNGDGTYENERVCFLLFCLRFIGFVGVFVLPTQLPSPSLV